ncbi:MAG: CRTAC1 family protein [Fuerstiella sp.]
MRAVIILFITSICAAGTWLLTGEVQSVHQSQITAGVLKPSKKHKRNQPDPLPVRSKLPAQVTLPEIPFQDVTKQSGIDFVHNNGLSSEQLFPETMGSGAAAIDINQDGLLDLVFVNGKHWDWTSQTTLSTVPASTVPASTVPTSTISAWINLGHFQFEEVTKDVGLDLSVFGMGIAAGDYDNDGDSDLYISAVGSNRLLRNDDGVFKDITERSGTGGRSDLWSTSTGWMDFDQDSDLDLVVLNYMPWSRQLEQVVDAISSSGMPRFGAPDTYPGATPLLFRNDGNDRFTEVSAAAGLMAETKSLGLVLLDVNGDSQTDFFVANDGVPNQLFVNQGDSTFRDIATECGVAVSDEGASRAGMGVDAADFRNDGTTAIAVGNYEGENCGLFVSVSPKNFMDQSQITGLSRFSRADLTWAMHWFDADLDGRLDLLTVNGHVENNAEYMLYADRYEQAVQLFWNSGREDQNELIPMTRHECGQDLFQAIAGRSALVEDLDNDGDLDVVLCSSGQSTRVFRNECKHEGRCWLRLKLVDPTGAANRDAIGAEVRLTVGEVIQQRFVSPSRGYLSSGSTNLTFGWAAGLDSDPSLRMSLEIIWPDGHVTQTELREKNVKVIMNRQTGLSTIQ